MEEDNGQYDPCGDSQISYHLTAVIISCSTEKPNRDPSYL